MITYEIPRPCYRCLCRVCGQAGCPHWNNVYRKRCQDCWFSHNFRPILDCENFYFKFFHKYKIKRVFSRPKVRYVDKTNADDLRVMLTEILGLLRSGAPTSPTTDVNCVRQNCLCLKCSHFERCDVRCNLCLDYRGQNPVIMCGLKLQRDRNL